MPYIFVWLQSAELLHQVGELHDKFTGEIPAVGSDQVDAATRLAWEIGDELGQLHDHSKSGVVAARVQASLQEHAMEVEQLSERLQ